VDYRCHLHADFCRGWTEVFDIVDFENLSVRVRCLKRSHGIWCPIGFNSAKICIVECQLNREVFKIEKFLK